MEKQFLKRSCDSPVCDTEEIIDPLNLNLQQMTRWIQLTFFKVARGPNGPQIQPEARIACRQQCATNILNTFSLAEEPKAGPVAVAEDPDKPDLEKLQAAAAKAN